MIVSVTASVYGCTLDERPVIAPKLHFSPPPQNRKPGVCTEYVRSMYGVQVKKGAAMIGT